MEENKAHEDPSYTLVEISKDTDIASWSEDKKKDFATTFTSRVNSARYIAFKTAQIIQQKALSRHYISLKHNRTIKDQYMGYGHHLDRSIPNLEEVAAERAELLIKTLPSLKQVVAIVDPETSKKIARRDILLAKANTLKEKLGEIGEAVILSELDPLMTIEALRKLINAKKVERRNLLNMLEDIGKEGSELETQICLALYSGIPELSQAIIDVINEHYEQVPALDTMRRRVTDQILFGDSSAALEMLKHFEKNELSLSNETTNKINLIIQKLRAKMKTTKSKRPSKAHLK